MGTQIEQWRESLDKALHDKNQPWADALEWAEGKTGIKRKYLLLGESDKITRFLASHTR
jgi:hypothetical protein